MRRRTVALAIAALAGLTLASCGGKDQPPAAAPKRPVIGLVMKSLANEFFKTMEEGAIAHAQKRGDLELVPVGMNSETDIDTQIDAVDNFIVRGVDAIVLAPADSKGLVPSVAKALKAGIPVVNFDVRLDEGALREAGLDLAFVGPDNRAGAKMAGDALAKALGPGGKVVIIEGNPGADNARERKEGFLDAVREHGLSLVDSRTAHWETEEANTVATNLLTGHPEIQGILCANDSMAIGVVRALEAAGKAGSIRVVGFDNIPAIRPLIRDGKVLATIDQFGPEMASHAIDDAMRVIAGAKLTGWIKTPVQVVTAAELRE